MMEDREAKNYIIAFRKGEEYGKQEEYSRIQKRIDELKKNKFSIFQTKKTPRFETIEEFLIFELEGLLKD